MKKLIAFVLALWIVMSLAACGDTSQPSPSAEPSVSPSDAPSVEPSAEPMDEKELYWQDKVLKPSGGDLMVDAARWVRDYYMSFSGNSVPEEQRIDPEIAAARIQYLGDDRLVLYTECYFYRHNRNDFFVDEYTEVNAANDYFALRSVYFEFEAVEGGYRYGGITEPQEGDWDFSMNTTVVRDGEVLPGAEDDVWLLETLIGAIADGEPKTEMPSDMKLIGSLNYTLSGISAQWDFYTCTAQEDDYTEGDIVAQCAASGEVVKLEYGADKLLYMPTPQELIDLIEQSGLQPFMIGDAGGNIYTTPEEAAEVLSALKEAVSGGNYRLYDYSRDVTKLSPDCIFIGRIRLNCENNWDEPGSVSEVGIGGYNLMLYDGSEACDAAQKLWQSKLSTLRSGTLLSEVEDEVLLTPTEETEMLRRAYRLFGIFDMSSITVDSELGDAACIERDGMPFYDLTALNDPTADDYRAHLGSYADFVEYTYDMFTDELAERCIDSGIYIEGPNGELYGTGVGRGGMNPAVGETLAYYKFEPSEGVMVVRQVHEHCSNDGSRTEWDNWKVDGESAWDMVFLWEDGRWKVNNISFTV